MELIEPSQFYTGLVAELYRPLRSVDPDPEPYLRFIALSGEPALELGCGDGDPLLDLRSQGIDVEGLDSSADMLRRCRAQARRRGLDVVLDEQPMQAMDLGRRYQSIYLAGPTFNLLHGDTDAAKALGCIRDHLHPGGSALIPLFVPTTRPPEALGQPKTHRTSDGIELRVTTIAENRDEARRCQTSHMRYERTTTTGTVSVERLWLLHWYTQDGFRQLATEVGLTVTTVLAPDATPASPDDEAFVFWLTRQEP